LWDTGGKNGGCIDVNYKVAYDYNVWVDVNKAALQFIRDNRTSVSFSIWINGDPYQVLDGYPRLISACQDFNAALVDENEVIEISCPIPRAGTGSVATFRYGKGNVDNNSVTTAGMALSAYAGTWQHYAFVRDGVGVGGEKKLRIYHNGEKIGDANATWPILVAGIPIEDFRLTTRDIGSESWLGKIDDFKIYDYALSDAQAGYIGTGGTGYVPFVNVANIKLSAPNREYVNFGDFAVIGQQWMTGPILWP
jgi:hypothetical protein